MHDIKGRKDIELLVNSFYDKAKKDETIGYIFNTIIGEDWSAHLPVMYSFWEMVLLHVQGYTGNPIQKHIEIDKQIPLDDAHFKRWLQLWTETIDNLFIGKVADDAKKRAGLMIQLISTKVLASRNPNFIQ